MIFIPQNKNYIMFYMVEKPFGGDPGVRGHEGPVEDPPGSLSSRSISAVI